MHAASSPAHLHNCGLCSCRSVTASTCPTPDCKTPRRPGCSCRRLPPPRTASCSRRTHLSGSMDKKNSKVGGHFAKQHLTNTTMWELRAGPARVTGVASTHVHVGHLSPAVAARIINLATFPHQGAVVAAYGVQQTFQHAYACSGK